MKIKRIVPILIGLSLSAQTALEAQRAFGGQPKSFSLGVVTDYGEFRSTSAGDQPIIPLFTVERQHSANELRAVAMNQVNAPMTAGEVIAVNYNLIKEGVRTLLTDGTVVYRMKIRGRNAKSLYLFFSQFDIPKGAKLYIYNPDKSIVLGAYTAETNPSGGEFAVEPVLGEELILEYEAPQDLELPRIVVDGVGYLYYRYEAHAIYQKAGEDEERTGCQEEANCELGKDWDDQKNSIVQILIKKDGMISLCSGTLLNNTNKDFKPYIITAGHCAAYKEGEYDFKESDLNRWVFTFHYIKPSCSRSTIGSIEAKSLVGCRKRVYLPMDKYSDGMLLELNEQIPLDYRVYYSGWDRRASIPKSGVSLHHPMGDAMKISVFDKTPEVGKWDGYNKGTDNAHLIMSFTHGETEGGSSGGGLFDATSKKLVATLTGGEETVKCLSTSRSWYGRLSYHWNYFIGQGNDKRMDIYLDPKTQGNAEVLEGTYRDNRRYFYPVTSVKALRSRTQSNLVQLEWESPKGLELLTDGTLYYDIRRGDVILQRIPHISGQKKYTYTDDITVNVGSSKDLSYSVRVVLENAHGGRTEWTSWSEPVGVYLGELPEQVDASNQDGKLSWKEPVLLQEWTRVPQDGNDQRFRSIPMAQIQKHPTVQIARQSTIKYAEKWPVGSLYSIREDDKYSTAYITQVKVLPRKVNEKFYINLDHGNGPSFRPKDFTDFKDKEPYQRRIPITVPKDWKPGTWLTHTLDKPLKVYPEYMLRIGFEASNNRQDPSSMSYMHLEETNQRYRFVGPLVMISVNSREEWYPIYFMSKQHKMLPEYWQGNMAFRLIVSTDSQRLEPTQNTDRLLSYSSALPAFPRPTSYEVHQGGRKIATITGGTSSSYTYNILSGNVSDYTVKPVYSAIPNTLSMPSPKKDIPVKIMVQGHGRVKLYGYPTDVKTVKQHSVVWADTYPDEGYELELLTANGKSISETGEAFVNADKLEIVAKFVKAKEPNSIDQISQSGKLGVYPNPIRTEAIVEGLAPGAVVRVYSIDGRLVYQAKSLDAKLKFEATSFLPGVYFLQTSQGDTTKFIVE